MPPRGLKSLLLTLSLAATIMSSTLASLPQPSYAAYGSSGAAVTSPPVIKSLSLEEFLSLPEKKRKQFEGGFLACVELNDDKGQGGWQGLLPKIGGRKEGKKVKVSACVCVCLLLCPYPHNNARPPPPTQVCKPVSVIDGLLNDMQEDERKFLELYRKVSDLDGADSAPLASEEVKDRER